MRGSKDSNFDPSSPRELTELHFFQMEDFCKWHCGIPSVDGSWEMSFKKSICMNTNHFS